MSERRHVASDRVLGCMKLDNSFFVEMIYYVEQDNDIEQSVSKRQMFKKRGSRVDDTVKFKSCNCLSKCSERPLRASVPLRLDAEHMAGSMKAGPQGERTFSTADIEHTRALKLQPLEEEFAPRTIPVGAAISDLARYLGHSGFDVGSHLFFTALTLGHGCKS